MESLNTETQPPPQQTPHNESVTITKIQSLLKAKDDTQRFVGLALLKSVLDNSPELRENHQVIQDLWASLSAKFLDRLLRTGSKPSKSNSKEMLDLVVSILHTFTALLPEDSRGQSKFIDRIPGLAAAVLYSSEETTSLLLQLLYNLVSTPEGAEALITLDDLSPLTEIAPSHPLVLDIVHHAFLTAMVVVKDELRLKSRLDQILQESASSFTGTDAVTYLEFLGNLLRQANPQILPLDPKWLPASVNYIRNLVTSRPNHEARSAYTNAAAALLQTYSTHATELLFKHDSKDEKPFPYLFVNLVLIDIRSSAPVLLEQLNTPQYPKTARRLTSAFDIICIFIGYLVRSLDDESSNSLVLPPEYLLKLRKGISETMSVALEYLRDRWDASVAGAMGLHQEARTSTAEASGISRKTLVWDSLDSRVEADPFILSTIRASALWLLEDENEPLRKEATGLTDMYIELYQASSRDGLDFRSPALLAFEALVTLQQGRELLLQHNGWQALSKDLVAIFQNQKKLTAEEASRGIDIVRVLLPVSEQEKGDTPEDWMGLVTSVAACDVGSGVESTTLQEFYVAVLQLCCALLVKSSPGLLKRYRHTLGAMRGVAGQVNKDIVTDSSFRESMTDILQTLEVVCRIASD